MRTAGFTAGVLVCLVAPASVLAKDALSVQVEATEAGLVVSESLEIGDVRRFSRAVLPLVLPEPGQGLAIVAKSEAHPDGLETDSTGLVDVSLEDGVVVVHKKTEGPDGEASAFVRYVLPVQGPRMILVMDIGLDLETLRFVTRGAQATGLHLRPLFPYAYTEETSEDGTWRMMTLVGGARPGTRLAIAASHLPDAGGAYRALALGAAAVTAAGFLAGLWRFRRRT